MRGCGRTKVISISFTFPKTTLTTLSRPINDIASPVPFASNTESALPGCSPKRASQRSRTLDTADDEHARRRRTQGAHANAGNGKCSTAAGKNVHCCKWQLELPPIPPMRQADRGPDFGARNCGGLLDPCAERNASSRSSPAFPLAQCSRF